MRMARRGFPRLAFASASSCRVKSAIRNRYFILHARGPALNWPLTVSEALKWIRETLSLVRRDYAVQFAGTMLGLVWLFFQYGFQIVVFFIVFGFLLPGKFASDTHDFLPYLLGA